MAPMAVRNAPERTPESDPVERDGEMCSVARQPILNLGGRLHGYELLFRDGPESVAGSDSDTAIDSLLDDTVTFGLERYTNGFPAFVACTPELLTGQLVQVLPPSITVLAVSENVEPTPALVESCRNLKDRGFKFAIDDFTGKAHPLMAVADYIRVDFSKPPGEGHDRIRQWLETGKIAMVAKRVETQNAYKDAAADGFTLFQGDFLFRPAYLKNRKVPANRLFHFEILQCLYREDTDLKRLSQLVMRDASLTYRLLRLVNSPVCAIRQQVRSVEAAIIVVGLDTFRRFATLAVLSEANTDQQSEILHMALVRARFCELAARMCRLNPGEQYLLGLFSLMPAMLRLPMEELTPALPLRNEVRDALEETRRRALPSRLVRASRAWGLGGMRRGD